jgi:predicted CXXCH cytochrome family protein
MFPSLLLALTVALQPTPPPAAEAAPSADECVSCHTDVDPAIPARSVHGGKASCVDCHPSAREIPHPERPLVSPRQATVTASEQCRRCHFTDYQRTLDSAHAGAVARGDLMAPVCVDCHGSHDMQRPNEPRTRVADTCARCHQGVATVYDASVHGRDVARNFADVPTCTDCHRTHDIGGPHQPGWKISTPELCGGCHADPARMEKYGLSTDVLKTYVQDFHGKTASLRKGSKSSDRQAFVALCTDCHGVHDITKVGEANSGVLKENLANTCRKCHEGASDNFPGSWLSHYEPSWQRTPVMYAVKVGYSVFIPFIIGGLILQMLLHLWRVAVNR